MEKSETKYIASCSFGKDGIATLLPALWDELLRLSLTPNLCSDGFKYGRAVQEIDEKINAINAQGSLFDD